MATRGSDNLPRQRVGALLVARPDWFRPRAKKTWSSHRSVRRAAASNRRWVRWLCWAGPPFPRDSRQRDLKSPPGFAIAPWPAKLTRDSRDRPEELEFDTSSGSFERDAACRVPRCGAPTTPTRRTSHIACRRQRLEPTTVLYALRKLGLHPPRPPTAFDFASNWPIVCVPRPDEAHLVRLCGKKRTGRRGFPSPRMADVFATLMARQSGRPLGRQSRRPARLPPSGYGATNPGAGNSGHGDHGGARRPGAWWRVRGARYNYRIHV